MTKRVYVWTHNWLSPIQKGIQGAHAVAELSSVCCTKPKAKACIAYQGWCLHHKTLVFLSGGNSAALSDLKEYLQGSLGGENQTYWSSFYEDEESLSSTMTAIAVLPTEMVCEAVDYCREMGWKDYRMLDGAGPDFNLTGWEVGLVNMIIGSRMAS
jgi:hypothetical protein